jgi:TPR repeat protein
VQNLAQIASRAVERGVHALAQGQSDPGDFESASEIEEPSESLRSNRVRLILIAAIVLASLALLGLLVLPHLAKPKVPTAASVKDVQPTLQTVALGFDGIKQRAAQGDPNAQYDLGLHYAIGDQVQEDQTEAARWFALAAEKGHVRAQSTMATHFWSGTGVRRDPKQAYFWALLARANGDETSKILAPQLEGSMTRAEIEEIRQQANDWLGHHQHSEAK